MTFIMQAGMAGQFGELLKTDEMGRTVSYPTYTCGHCSSIVAMRPDRVRPRKKCLSCNRMVCDNEICDPQAAGCTPIYGLADDHFEDKNSDRALRARAIMKGATTLEEVEKLKGGLII